MREQIQNFRRELRPMLRLALPLVLAELGWMTMGVVDTMMVGRLPNAAEVMGGVGLGSILFYTIGIFGSGLLLGLDTLVSQAYGAGRLDDCHRSLASGVFLSLALAPVLMALVWLLPSALRLFGVHPAVMREAVPYLHVISWSTLPLLLYTAFRRYLQGMNLVKPVTFALVTANLVNAFANWILIYGNLGAPALGGEGAGWATCISRVYMTAVLMIYAARHEGKQNGLMRTPFRPEPARIRRLVRLGLPAALQLGLEVGVFATATALIGKLDPESLAAHQVAMMIISVTFMVPLGISSAAAVRVGQALGRGDRHGAARAGWTAMALGAGFMSCGAVVFLAAPGAIMRAFTPDAAVIRTGIALLAIAAFFQLFDGVQVVATGALRGAGDTRTPMISHLIGYWFLGLPLGYVLCFGWGWGALGMWAGLSLALITIGLVLLLAWRRKVPALGAGMPIRVPSDAPV